MTASAMDQLRETLSDRYAIEAELGAGGMAVVYRARDLRHQRSVAIKLLRPELAAVVGHDRFLKEIRLTANLQHPHILPLYDSGEAAGRLFYVMPFVEGESLRARLASGSLPIPEAVRILSDVAQALSFAHARGVIHRDIKPDNVLLTAGAAIVADFGIAKAVAASRSEAGESATSTGISLGTPAYMAPEQAAADPRVDHRADLYAFGCLAYELLSGRAPFDGSPQRVLAGHLSEPPRPIHELRPDTPAPLAELVMRCLEKEPGARPQQAAELVAPLEMAAAPAAKPTPVAQMLGVGLAAALLLILAARVATDQLGLPDWVFSGAALLSGAVLGLILLAAVRTSPRFTWQRAARSGLVTVGAFVLFTAGYMGMRSTGIGGPGTLFAKKQLPERPVLLITDFTVRSADSALGLPTAEAVRFGLGQSGAIKLIEPEQVRSALQRMRRPVTSRLDVALGRELAAREGIAAIVDGDVVGVGDRFIITIRLIGADSGNLLAGPFQRTTADLIEGADALVRKLRGKIGESLKTVRATRALPELTTASFEALRLYSEAMREEQIQLRVQQLRRVVALDSNFASAWRSLAGSMRNSRFPLSSHDSAITRAYALRDRLPDRERYAIEYFYFIGPGADGERAFEAVLAQTRIDPTPGALTNLGMIYRSRRDWVQAESLFRLANHAYNLAMPLFALGREAEIGPLTQAALARNPNLGPLLMNNRRLLYHRAGADSFALSLDSAVRHGAYGALGPIVTGARAAVAQLQGRLGESERLWKAVAVWDDSLQVPHLDLRDSIRSAHFDAWYRDRPERAVARMTAALKLFPFEQLSPIDRPYGAVAALYARAGRPDLARPLLDRLVAQGGDIDVRRAGERGRRAAAEIALAEGRTAEAIAGFRQADQGPNALSTIVGVGRAFDRAGEADSAIGYYERFLSTRYWWRAVTADPEHGHSLDEPSDVIYLALVRRRLGELYEQKGEVVKAAQHYRQFIELWKDADPELQPRVAEARRRLTRLADREPLR